MANYEVDLRVEISTDGSTEAETVIKSLLAALAAAGTPARAEPSSDGSFTIEVQLPASAPSDAVLEATGRLRDAAALQRVRTWGRVPIDDWYASIKERAVTARELPSEVVAPADSAALAL